VRVKELKDCLWDYQADGIVTVTYFTDMPGTTMALRTTLTLPVTTGRQSKVHPLDGIEGTLMSITVDPAAKCILYGGVLRWRVIGTYIDGANGEIWQTQEFGIGN